MNIQQAEECIKKQRELIDKLKKENNSLKNDLIKWQDRCMKQNENMIRLFS